MICNVNFKQLDKANCFNSLSCKQALVDFCNFQDYYSSPKNFTVFPESELLGFCLEKIKKYVYVNNSVFLVLTFSKSLSTCLIFSENFPLHIIYLYILSHLLTYFHIYILFYNE